MLNTFQTSFLFDVMKVKHKNLDLDVKQTHLDELGRAILRQALQDAHDSDMMTRQEARQWLEVNGEVWASGLEMDWLTGDMILNHLQHGKRRIKKEPYSRKQDSLDFDTLELKQYD